MCFRNTKIPAGRSSLWRIALALLLLAACGSQVEKQSRADLDRVRTQLRPEPLGDSAGHPEAPDASPSLGTLRSYVASAFANSPELHASYEEWRAALEGPAQARRFPELVLTYGGFIRAVETRVGPQRHRVGVMQWFPWPTRLNAGRDAAAHVALSSQRRFEAHALDVAAEVARAYWRLWFIQKNQLVQQAQRNVLASLSEQVRTRLEAGRSGLSELAQVDLSISRISDVIAGLQEAERGATAGSFVSSGRRLEHRLRSSPSTILRRLCYLHRRERAERRCDYAPARGSDGFDVGGSGGARAGGEG